MIASTLPDFRIEPGSAAGAVQHLESFDGRIVAACDVFWPNLLGHRSCAVNFCETDESAAIPLDSGGTSSRLGVRVASAAASPRTT